MSLHFWRERHVGFHIFVGKRRVFDSFILTGIHHVRTIPIATQAVSVEWRVLRGGVKAFSK